MDAKGFATDADLGRISGMDGSLLSRWQNGEAAPSIDSLRKVAPHLGVRLGDLMIEAGLATPAELGTVGAPPAPAPPLPPPLRRAAQILMDPRIPDRAKATLLKAITAAVEVWSETMGVRAPREPSATQRATGRTVR